LPNDWLAGDAGSVYYGVKVAEKQITQLLQLELQGRRRDVLWPLWMPRPTRSRGDDL